MNLKNIAYLFMLILFLACQSQEIKPIKQDQFFDLKTYFEKYISYELNEKKKEALRLFLFKIDQTTRPEDAIQPVFA